MKTYHIIDNRESNVKGELVHYTFEQLKNYFEPDANELPEEYKEWQNIHDLYDLESFLQKSYAGMEIPYTFEEVEEFESLEQMESANSFLKIAR